MSLATALKVPGTASLEPLIQEICHRLESRLADRPDSRFDHQGDWQLLLSVSKLHSDALSRVDAAERREFGAASRMSSGWWGESDFSKKARKATDSGLERTLVCNILASGQIPDAGGEVKRRLQGPGVFVLRHKRLAPFVYVGRETFRLLGSIQRLLSLAFDGVCCVDARFDEATAVVATALLLTRQSDWQVTVVSACDEQELLAVQNEMILRYKTLWPKGLNASLNQTLACLKELRELGWRADNSRRRHQEKAGVSDDSCLAAKRLGLRDLEFEDFRQLAFDADDSGLYRCDDEVHELGGLIRQLKARKLEFRQVDFAFCHRLHDMMATISRKECKTDELRYRREIRRHSGWWGQTASHQATSGDSDIASLDCLVQILAGKLWDEDLETSDRYERLQTPGLFVLRHSTRPCWRYVSRPCANVLTRFRSLLHLGQDGFPSTGCPSSSEDLASNSADSCVAACLLLLSTEDEWQLELHAESDAISAAELFNRLTLEHGSLWPGGANLSLMISWETLPALHQSLG